MGDHYPSRQPHHHAPLGALVEGIRCIAPFAEGQRLSACMERLTQVDWRDVYAGRVRAIEALYGEVHEDMLEWGRWGRERFPGKPRLMLSGVWVMAGEPDPDRDPNAPPVHRAPPFDELRVISLDARINAYGFPSLWVGVLKANYIPPKLKHSSALHVLPEYQRPAAVMYQDKRGMDPETYIEQLSNALDFLRA